MVKRKNVEVSKAKVDEIYKERWPGVKASVERSEFANRVAYKKRLGWKSKRLKSKIKEELKKLYGKTKGNHL